MGKKNQNEKVSLIPTGFAGLGAVIAVQIERVNRGLLREAEIGSLDPQTGTEMDRLFSMIDCQIAFEINQQKGKKK